MGAESDGKNTARLECQGFFLYICQEHPEIRLLHTLRESVFNKRPQGDELDRLLRVWARSHHLEYPWVLREASHLYRRSLVAGTSELHYVKYADLPGAKFATFESLVPRVYVGPPFQPPPWVPLETLKGYRRRVTAQFKGHFDAVINEYKRSRQPLLSRRRQGSGEDPAAPTVQADHYRWAAEYICLERGWVEIAEEYAKKSKSLYPQAISEAVLKVLKNIQIQPRTRLRSLTISAR